MQPLNQVPQDFQIPWPQNFHSELQKFKAVEQPIPFTGSGAAVFPRGGTSESRQTDVAVDVAEINVLVTCVAVKFVVRSDDDPNLWSYFEQNREALESLISSTIAGQSEGRAELQKIVFRKGSVEIWAFVGAANTFLSPYMPLITTASSAVGLYPAIKMLVNDVKKLIPTLQQKIRSFFSGFKRKSFANSRRATPQKKSFFSMLRDFLGF